MGIITCIISNMVRGITLNVMGFVFQWVQNVANFYSYFLLGLGVRFVNFLLVVTFNNYILLGQEGQGLYSIHDGTGGKGAPWIFPFFFFLKLLRGRGGGRAA
jgi:hypothetical protein